MDLNTVRHVITNWEDISNLESEPCTLGRDDIILYQPKETGQILLPDIASNLTAKAFLKMCDLTYSVQEKHNIEEMSPSGELPVLKSGQYLLSGVDTIIQFIGKRGVSLTKHLDDSQKAELQAYISLVTSVIGSGELYVTWADKETYETLTKSRYGSVHPWPLNCILSARKQKRICKKLDALGWLKKTDDEICEEIDKCCNALSNRLEEQYYFGNKPNELDAVVFAHVYTILTAPQHKNQLRNIVLGYPKIVGHCQRTINDYFNDCQLIKPIENL